MNDSANQSMDNSKRGLIATGGLLVGFLFHNLIYPLSTDGGGGAIFFYLVYASLFPAATWLLTDGRWLRILSLLSGIAAFAAGVMNSMEPSSQAAFAVYVTSIIYHAVIIIVLARYTFGAKTVMTDVLLAATSLFLIIGSAFGAIFALIEWLEPGSFTASDGNALDWQQLLYFSYATLTTLGYGDITPKGFYAQAFAAFEAVLGVLYTVILLARLVGLHASQRDET